VSKHVAGDGVGFTHKYVALFDGLAVSFVNEADTKVLKNYHFLSLGGGTYIYGGPLMVAQWLRYCATNRKVAGSIPDGVIGIFH
jgi:hypothetical protein